MIIPLGHPDGDTQSARENKQIDELRDRDVVLPAIVISGMDEAEALHELLRRRRADYLRKSFRLQEVIQQVGRVLNKELAE